MTRLFFGIIFATIAAGALPARSQVTLTSQPVPTLIPDVEETPSFNLCPKGAIGFVSVAKGGIEVGGSNFKDDLHNGVLTAWFSLVNSPQRAVMTLDMATLTPHAVVGTVQKVHDQFCAFP